MRPVFYIIFYISHLNSIEIHENVNTDTFFKTDVNEWSDGYCIKNLDQSSQDCKDQSSIRYFFDNDRQECFAFNYSGCAAIKNYKTRKYCSDSCITPEEQLCPGMAEETLPVNGRMCDGSKITCQDGAYCRISGRTNICCDIQSKEENDIDLNSETCPGGGKKYMVVEEGEKIALVSKNCSIKFCPQDYQCQMGNYSAYCCK